MKKLLKNEYMRVLRNGSTILVLLASSVIMILHVVTEVLPYSDKIYLLNYPMTVFEKWIGGENHSVYSSLYYLLIPILIAIPYIGTLKQDLKTGYYKNIFIRTDKRKYFLVKYIVTFTTSGVLAVIPLILNFMLTAMVLPATIPQANTAFYGITSMAMLGDLFYVHPYQYLLVYMCLNIVFFGLLSTLGLLASYFTDYVFVCVLTPFLIYVFLYGGTMISRLFAYSPFGFLRPSQPIAANVSIIIIECGVMLFMGGVVYLVIGVKREVY